MTAEAVGGRAEATDVPPASAGRSIRLLAIVALVAAVLWLGGLGSLVAVVLAVVGLRMRPAQRLDRRLLQVALALGVVGLLVTAISFGMLASSTSTSS